MAEKIPTVFNYNSNDNKFKTIDQVNTEIKDLIQIRKELRAKQTEILRERRLNEDLEKYQYFI
tara:strand:+ start:172 stop:360 length:189 start_codon:yes stop_codon:yes gene_type:complete